MTGHCFHENGLVFLAGILSLAPKIGCTFEKHIPIGQLVLLFEQYRGVAHVLPYGKERHEESG
jgi:hypothetical protein